MPHSWLERRRIHRQAKAKIGVKQSPQEHFDFVEQCIQGMVGDGATDDEDEARQICELLYEEQVGWDNFGGGEF